MKSLVLKFLKKITGGKKRDDSSQRLANLEANLAYYEDLLFCAEFLEDYSQWVESKTRLTRMVHDIKTEIDTEKKKTYCRGFL